MTSEETYQPNLFGPALLKQMAEESGEKPHDMLVNSQSNDPFFVGYQPRTLGQAKWFSDIFYQFRKYKIQSTGNRDPIINIRQIHYWLQSLQNPLMHNGKPYENTSDCAEYLNNAAKYARTLDMVPYGMISDLKNDQVQENAYKNAEYYNLACEADIDTLKYSKPEVTITIGDIEKVKSQVYTTSSLINVASAVYDALQPYHVEIWIEKSTHNDILEPLCRRYNVNLMVFSGEPSATRIFELVERAKRVNKPVRILYVSDFDPRGYLMPSNAARKIEFHLLHDYLDLDIKLEPIILTYAQRQFYQLPTTPTKSGDKAAPAFIRKFGENAAAELDALEALHPGEFARIVEGSILKYYDQDLREMCKSFIEDRGDDWDEKCESYIEEANEQITRLNKQIADIRSKYQTEVERLNTALASDIQPIIDKIDKLSTEVKEKEKELKDGFELELPEADLDPDDEECLYDSARSYLEQLDYQKDYRPK